MNDEQRQTILDHLVELRVRLVKSAYAIVAGFAACWWQSENLFDIIRRPISPYLPGGGLIFTAPMDKFLAHVKVSLLAGIILSCPFWLFQIWKFIAPGLYQRERRYAGGFLGAAIFFFLLGVSFTYFVVFPMAFHFLMNFGGSVDRPLITIDQYLSFFMTTTLGFGVSFEMPVIISVLGMLGIVSSAFLRSKRRYAIMIIAVLSAIITPPDALSMLMMLVPMWVLYELSILSVMYFERVRKQEEQSES